MCVRIIRTHTEREREREREKERERTCDGWGMGHGTVRPREVLLASCDRERVCV